MKTINENPFAIAATIGAMNAARNNKSRGVELEPSLITKLESIVTSHHFHYDRQASAKQGDGVFVYKSPNYPGTTITIGKQIVGIRYWVIDKYDEASQRMKAYRGRSPEDLAKTFRAIHEGVGGCKTFAQFIRES